MSRSLLVPLTIAVMIAFAMNSVIGRAALKPDSETLIDPASYTTIRIGFGAAVLALIRLLRRTKTLGEERRKSGWLPAFMLALYAVTFSFAYIGLDTASGTLILFAFVQLTMVGVALSKGDRPGPLEIAGLAVATIGLIYLLAPALREARLVKESVLMALAGIGWGAYSVLGRGSSDPISDTSGNFARAVPFAVAVSAVAVAFSQPAVTSRGFLLAAVSGGVTSGLGYVLWYVVLPHLKSTQAAAVQLSVPIIAAVGGVVFAGDVLSERTIIAGLLIVSGIAMTVDWKPAKRASDS